MKIMVEAFALICMTWGILMTIVITLLTNHSHQGTSLVSKGLEDSDIELSVICDNIKVYNDIFDDINDII